MENALKGNGDASCELQTAERALESQRLRPLPPRRLTPLRGTCGCRTPSALGRARGPGAAPPRPRR